MATRGSFLLVLAFSLDRVRADPALASDPAAIDALVREADAAPPSAERADAWALAAEAYAARLGRLADAERLHHKIKDDPAADPVVRRKARSDLVGLLVLRGALDEAELVARGEDALERRVRTAKTTRDVGRASTIVLVALAVFAIAGAARGARSRIAPALRRLAPVAFGYAAYLGLVGALLATRYETGTARPFLYFGVALVPVLVVARAWSAAGGTSALARSGRALLCTAGVASAAFLAYTLGTRP